MPATVHASLLRAGLARLRAPDTVAGALRQVIELADAADMQIEAAAARHHLGAEVGGDTGAELSRTATEWFERSGFGDPPRMANCVCPGFRSCGEADR